MQKIFNKGTLLVVACALLLAVVGVSSVAASNPGVKLATIDRSSWG
jgi:hypothetical protein